MIGNISIKIFDSLPTTNLLLISDSDYESNQSETEENHQYSIVPKETFIELQRFSGEWKYTDNSYYMDDNKESYTETKKISCGFFQYMNSNWYNKTGSFMKSLIIKCRYEELKDGNIAVLFTPFVVVKSIRYENAVNICRKLYADTEIGKWLENTTERISYVLLLNLIECFTNLYTWILFESKLKIYFNTSEIKLDLLQNNLNPVFLDTIKMMFTWKQIDFESRIEQVNKIGNIATWTQEKNNNVSLNTIEEVYELLYQQVIEMKREKNTDNFVTIEQMENMVSQQNQELLTGSLLQMLDQNILEQNTVYQNGMILHVFRCGNNSDIVLPFYNPYIMYAVYLKEFGNSGSRFAVPIESVRMVEQAGRKDLVVVTKDTIDDDGYLTDEEQPTIRLFTMDGRKVGTYLVNSMDAKVYLGGSTKSAPSVTVFDKDQIFVRADKYGMKILKDPKIVEALEGHTVYCGKEYDEETKTATYYFGDEKQNVVGFSYRETDRGPVIKLVTEI